MTQNALKRPLPRATQKAAEASVWQAGSTRDEPGLKKGNDLCRFML